MTTLHEPTGDQRDGGFSKPGFTSRFTGSLPLEPALPPLGGAVSAPLLPPTFTFELSPRPDTPALPALPALEPDARPSKSISEQLHSSATASTAAARGFIERCHLGAVAPGIRAADHMFPANGGTRVDLIPP